MQSPPNLGTETGLAHPQAVPPASITASMLYDLATCERRCHHDLHSDASLRDPQSEFVKMLWACGREHEADVLGAIDGVADLREVPPHERFEATLVAMGGGADVILGGRLQVGDLLGMPDVLRRIDRVWTAGDVKMGAAVDPDNGRPRLDYGVQVGLYAELLRLLGFGTGERAFVIGSDGLPVDYDLLAPFDRSGRSLAVITSDLVAKARAIRDKIGVSRGAMAAACKLCHWHTVCEEELISADDLTLIAGCGRAARDAIAPVASTVSALAHLDLATVVLPGGRTTIKGIGAERLGRFQDRARLLVTPGAEPFARRPLGLRRWSRELHYDVEADPSRGGLIYLHGFWERTVGGNEGRYVRFFAETPEQEREVFARAYGFIAEDPAALLVYYSRYERTSMRSLQARYPEICSPEDIEALFQPERSVDLLSEVVMPATEWPTRNVSIKTLARYLGFEWEDVDAGGANSIAWFDAYLRGGCDPTIRERIEIYNRNDVQASAVLFDGLLALPVRSGPTWPMRTLP